MISAELRSCIPHLLLKWDDFLKHMVKVDLKDYIWKLFWITQAVVKTNFIKLEHCVFLLIFWKCLTIVYTHLFSFFILWAGLVDLIYFSYKIDIYIVPLKTPLGILLSRDRQLLDFFNWTICDNKQMQILVVHKIPLASHSSFQKAFSATHCDIHESYYVSKFVEQVSHWLRLFH